MIIREHYLKQIRPFYNKRLVKVITGIRRSGKSTFLKQIMEEIKTLGVDKENIIYLNLDSFQNKELLETEKLYSYINSKVSNDKKYYLFLDEIQEVSGFEKLVNDFNEHRNFDVYITGSNSTMLASEFQTYLTGRYISFHIYPFSFKEIAQSDNSNKTNDQIFLEYIKYGGLPQLMRFEDDATKKKRFCDIAISFIIFNIVLNGTCEYSIYKCQFCMGIRFSTSFRSFWSYYYKSFIYWLCSNFLLYGRRNQIAILKQVRKGFFNEINNIE